MKTHYKQIIEFIQSLGYDRLQEDININGEDIINFYDTENKNGLNITTEFY